MPTNSRFIPRLSEYSEQEACIEGKPSNFLIKMKQLHSIGNLKHRHLAPDSSIPAVWYSDTFFFSAIPCAIADRCKRFLFF